MRKRTKFSIISAVVAVLLLIASLFALSHYANLLHAQVVLPGYDKRVYIVRSKDGLRFELRSRKGVERLSPEKFAELVYLRQAERPWWFSALNITKPSGVAWVLIGFLGQLLFSGRMLVQWIASEKRRESVIPVTFWWLALGGASMLLTYFIWRRDIIGIIGQGTGWFIYVRNLYFIYLKNNAGDSALTQSEERG